MTEVAIAGDARAVWLDGPEGRFEMPASVPPGRYKVQADFGEGLTSAGQVVVGSERVQIECQSFLFLCGPK